MAFLPKIPRRCKAIAIFCKRLFVFLVLLLGSIEAVHVLKHHRYGLDYHQIFQKQFSIYILTRDCQRYTADIAAHFSGNAILVPDIHDSPHCDNLGPKLLLPTLEHVSRDRAFRQKYTDVLDHCAANNKMRCLLLEDDVLFLHKKERSLEIIVENTLSLFNREQKAYDCTKRGFGWLTSTPNGYGSQCRIYGKYSSNCMSKCLQGVGRKNGFGDRLLDNTLGLCESKCSLTSSRFLIIQHTGLNSTMERPI